MEQRLHAEQVRICEKHGASPFATDPATKVGLSRDFDPAIEPLNGMRIPPHGDVSGWYIWTGEEMSSDEDFFVPVHITHLAELCPTIQKYLLLPPGWRFLLAEDYEDIWYEESVAKWDEKLQDE